MLPARIPGYQPRLLDELGALGEVAWVGRGSLGRDDGRIALVRPGREVLRPVGSPDGAEPPAEPRHVAIREHLAGARRVVLPRAVRGGARDVGPRGPRRAVGPGVGRRGHQRHVRAAARPALEADGERRAPDRRPAGRLTALGPPEAAGRWSLVAPAGRRPRPSGSTRRASRCSSATAC